MPRFSFRTTLIHSRELRTTDEFCKTTEQGTKPERNPWPHTFPTVNSRPPLPQMPQNAVLHSLYAIGQSVPKAGIQTFSSYHLESWRSKANYIPCLWKYQLTASLIRSGRIYYVKHIHSYTLVTEYWTSTSKSSCQFNHGALRDERWEKMMDGKPTQIPDAYFICILLIRALLLDDNLPYLFMRFPTIHHFHPSTSHG